MAKNKKKTKALPVNAPKLLLIASIIIFAFSFFLLPKFLKPTIFESITSLAFFLITTYFFGYTFTHKILESKDRKKKVCCFSGAWSDISLKNVQCFNIK